MYKISNFYSNQCFKSKKFKKNLKDTKNIFEKFKLDLKKNKFSFFESFQKKYKLNFKNNAIQKYSKYKNIIIIGMGGSILGTKSIYSFFKKKVKKKLFFFDNLDVHLYEKFNEIKNIQNSCVIVVSKSGETLETISNFEIIFKKISIKNKLIFITESGSNSLRKIASKLDCKIIEHKKNIGGRFSVLSESSMLPAKLMNLKVNNFRNLDRLISNKKFVESLINSVASIYTLNQIGFNNSVILNYDSHLNDLGSWYEQLVAESLGKKGKGINPILSFGPMDHHSLLQNYLEGPKDKFFTFFTSSENNKKYKISSKAFTDKMKFLNNKTLSHIINSQALATKNIFKSKNIPLRHILFNKKNEEELGSIFTFFVLETILLARIMRINPLNQPSVEEVKVETKKILSN
jgi:glucose-6-phosphate isomerase